MCFMTSGGGAEVIVDGSTAPWWMLMPKYWDEDGDVNAEDGMLCSCSCVVSCVVRVVCGVRNVGDERSEGGPGSRVMRRRARREAKWRVCRGFNLYTLD